MKNKITPFLNGEEKITQLPMKHSVQVAVLSYLIEKFEVNRGYTEKEVNAICDEWHTFHDFFVLRRCMVEEGLLVRKADGSCYWRVASNQGGNCNE